MAGGWSTADPNDQNVIKAAMFAVHQTYPGDTSSKVVVVSAKKQVGRA